MLPISFSKSVIILSADPGIQGDKETRDPELVCLNRIQKDVDDDREDANRKNIQLIVQLESMNFSTPVIFDLD